MLDGKLRIQRLQKKKSL